MVNQNKRLIKTTQKIIAFFLLISFTLLNTSQNSFTYAETLPVSSASHHGIKKANPSALLGSFELPEELGMIQERFIPDDKKFEKFVIYLQSAHTNYDSESNTKKLIEFFQKEYGLPLVLLEGGAGNLDSLYFKSFPDGEMKQKILNDYLKKGDLSGGEIASILNDDFDTRYYGIEEPSLYDQNKSVFLKAIEKGSAISKELDQLELNLNGKINQLSEQAKHFLEKERAFRSEQIDLLEYVKELGPLGSDFPELAKLLQASESEVRIKNGDIDATVTQVIKTFQQKILPQLPKPQQMEMNQMIQMYRLGHLSHGLLIKRIEDLAKSQNFFFETPQTLKPSVKQAQMISSIKGTKLFDELEALEDELRKTLAQSEEERNILQSYHELRFFRSFAKLEITHKEWREIQQIAFVKAGLFQSHFDFYRLAEKRDETLFQNTLRTMDQEKAQLALISTGGFHSEGITKKLKEANIPYLLIAPKITKLDDRAHYLKVMRDERSFMKYFQGSLWDALAKDYAAKLASSLKQEELTPSLKRWRDRIIQNSIAEGKITEAGTYTRYVDALVQALRKEYEKGSPLDFEIKSDNEDSIRLQLEKELDSLLPSYFDRLEAVLKNRLQTLGDGLRELWKTGNFTPDSISKVLDRVNSPSGSTLAAELALIKVGVKPLVPVASKSGAISIDDSTVLEVRDAIVEKIKNEEFTIPELQEAQAQLAVIGFNRVTGFLGDMGIKDESVAATILKLVQERIQKSGWQAINENAGAGALTSYDGSKAPMKRESLFPEPPVSQPSFTALLQQDIINIGISQEKNVKSQTTKTAFELVSGRSEARASRPKAKNKAEITVEEAFLNRQRAAVQRIWLNKRILSDDHPVTQYVRGLLGRITRDHHPKLYIIEDKEINGFATGTNEIYLTTGMLRFPDTEEDLFSVLMHELTHIERGDAFRHRDLTIADPYYLGVKRFAEFHADMAMMLEIDKRGINPIGALHFTKKMNDYIMKQRISGKYASMLQGLDLTHGSMSQRHVKLRELVRFVDLEHLSEQVTPLEWDSKKIDETTFQVLSEEGLEKLIQSDPHDFWLQFGRIHQDWPAEVWPDAVIDFIKRRNLKLTPEEEKAILLTIHFFLLNQEAPMTYTINGKKISVSSQQMSRSFSPNLVIRLLEKDVFKRIGLELSPSNLLNLSAQAIKFSIQGRTLKESEKLYPSIAHLRSSVETYFLKRFGINYEFMARWDSFLVKIFLMEYGVKGKALYDLERDVPVIGTKGRGTVIHYNAPVPVVPIPEPSVRRFLNETKIGLVIFPDILPDLLDRLGLPDIRMTVEFFEHYHCRADDPLSLEFNKNFRLLIKPFIDHVQSVMETQDMSLFEAAELLRLTNGEYVNYLLDSTLPSVNPFEKVAAESEFIDYLSNGPDVMALLPLIHAFRSRMKKLESLDLEALTDELKNYWALIDRQPEREREILNMIQDLYAFITVDNEWGYWLDVEPEDEEEEGDFFEELPPGILKPPHFSWDDLKKVILLHIYFRINKKAVLRSINDILGKPRPSFLVTGREEEMRDWIQTQLANRSEARASELSARDLNELTVLTSKVKETALEQFSEQSGEQILNSAPKLVQDWGISFVNVRRPLYEKNWARMSRSLNSYFEQNPQFPQSSSDFEKLLAISLLAQGSFTAMSLASVSFREMIRRAKSFDQALEYLKIYSFIPRTLVREGMSVLMEEQGKTKPQLEAVWNWLQDEIERILDPEGDLMNRAAAEAILRLVNPEERLEFFKHMISTNFTDRGFKEYVANKWWKGIRNAALNVTNIRDIAMLGYYGELQGIQEKLDSAKSRAGELIADLVGMDYLYFEELYPSFFRLDSVVIYLVLQNLMLEGGYGLFRNKDAKRELVRHIVNHYIRLPSTETTDRVLADIESVIAEDLDPEDLFYFLGPAMAEMSLQVPEQSYPTEQIINQLLRDFLNEMEKDFPGISDETKFPQTQKILRSRIEAFVTGIIPQIKRKGRKLEVAQTKRKAFLNFEDAAMERLAGLVSERKVFSSKVTPIELAVEVAKHVGSLAIRLLQLAGMYFELSPEDRKVISQVFDAVRGQTKLQAYLILKRKAEESPQLKALFEQLTEIGDMLGGGSIVTVFAGKDAQENRSALGINNPNAAYRSRELLKFAHQVLDGLIKRAQTKDAPELEYYELLKLLLNDANEWVAHEIDDPDYIKKNALFTEQNSVRSRKPDKFKPANGLKTRLFIPKVEDTVVAHVRWEEEIEGESFNNFLTGVAASGSEQDLKRAKDMVATITQDAFFQLFETGIVHSDIHPGQFLMMPRNQLAYLDRKNILILDETSQDLLFQVISDAALGNYEQGFERVAMHFMTEEQRKDGKLMKKLKKDIYKGYDFTKPIERNLHQTFTRLKRAGIHVPLEWFLIAKNFSSLNRMAILAGFDSMIEALIYAPGNGQVENPLEQAVLTLTEILPKSSQRLVAQLGADWLDQLMNRSEARNKTEKKPEVLETQPPFKAQSGDPVLRYLKRTLTALKIVSFILPVVVLLKLPVWPVEIMVVYSLGYGLFIYSILKKWTQSERSKGDLKNILKNKQLRWPRFSVAALLTFTGFFAIFLTVSNLLDQNVRDWDEFKKLTTYIVVSAAGIIASIYLISFVFSLRKAKSEKSAREKQITPKGPIMTRRHAAMAIGGTVLGAVLLFYLNQITHIVVTKMKSPQVQVSSHLQNEYTRALEHVRNLKAIKNVSFMDLQWTAYEIIHGGILMRYDPETTRVEKDRVNLAFERLSVDEFEPFEGWVPEQLSHDLERFIQKPRTFNIQDPEDRAAFVYLGLLEVLEVRYTTGINPNILESNIQDPLLSKFPTAAALFQFLAGRDTVSLTMEDLQEIRFHAFRTILYENLTLLEQIEKDPNLLFPETRQDWLEVLDEMKQGGKIMGWTQDGEKRRLVAYAYRTLPTPEDQETIKAIDSLINDVKSSRIDPTTNEGVKEIQRRIRKYLEQKLNIPPPRSEARGPIRAKGLEQGIEQLERLILQQMSSDRPLIISLLGGGGMGTTTSAEVIQAGGIKNESREMIIHPQEIAMIDGDQYIGEMFDRKGGLWLRYKNGGERLYQAGQVEDNLNFKWFREDLINAIENENKKIVLVAGMFSLRLLQESGSHPDIQVMFTADFDVRRERVRQRTIQKGGTIEEADRQLEQSRGALIRISRHGIAPHLIIDTTPKILEVPGYGLLTGIAANEIAPQLNNAAAQVGQFESFSALALSADQISILYKKEGGSIQSTLISLNFLEHAQEQINYIFRSEARQLIVTVQRQEDAISIDMNHPSLGKQSFQLRDLEGLVQALEELKGELKFDHIEIDEAKQEVHLFVTKKQFVPLDLNSSIALRNNLYLLLDVHINPPHYDRPLATARRGMMVSRYNMQLWSHNYLEKIIYLGKVRKFVITGKKKQEGDQYESIEEEFEIVGPIHEAAAKIITEMLALFRDTPEFSFRLTANNVLYIEDRRDSPLLTVEKIDETPVSSWRQLVKWVNRKAKTTNAFYELEFVPEEIRDQLGISDQVILAGEEEAISSDPRAGSALRKKWESRLRQAGIKPPFYLTWFSAGGKAFRLQVKPVERAEARLSPRTAARPFDTLPQQRAEARMGREDFLEIPNSEVPDYVSRLFDHAGAEGTSLILYGSMVRDVLLRYLFKNDAGVLELLEIMKPEDIDIAFKGTSISIDDPRWAEFRKFANQDPFTHGMKLSDDVNPHVFAQMKTVFAFDAMQLRMEREGDQFRVWAPAGFFKRFPQKKIDAVGDIDTALNISHASKMKKLVRLVPFWLFFNRAAGFDFSPKARIGLKVLIEDSELKKEDILIILKEIYDRWAEKGFNVLTQLPEELEALGINDNKRSLWQEQLDIILQSINKPPRRAEARAEDFVMEDWKQALSEGVASDYVERMELLLNEFKRKHADTPYYDHPGSFWKEWDPKDTIDWNEDKRRYVSKSGAEVPIVNQIEFLEGQMGVKHPVNYFPYPFYDKRTGKAVEYWIHPYSHFISGKVPMVDKDEGVRQIKSLVQEKLADGTSPIYMVIGGRPGAGKTTLADELAKNGVEGLLNPEDILVIQADKYLTRDLNNRKAYKVWEAIQLRNSEPNKKLIIVEGVDWHHFFGEGKFRLHHEPDIRVFLSVVDLENREIWKRIIERENEQFRRAEHLLATAVPRNIADRYGGLDLQVQKADVSINTNPLNMRSYVSFRRSEPKADEKSPHWEWVSTMRERFRKEREQIWEEIEPLEEHTAAYTSLAESFIRKIYEKAKEQFPEEFTDGKEPLALVRLGSFGRGEPGYGSDLEGRVVLTGEHDAPQAAHFIYLATTDIFGQAWPRLLVDDPIPMSVSGERKFDEGELAMATELLDARFIVGNKKIYEDRIASYREQLRAQGIDLVKALIDIWDDRYKRGHFLEGLFEREPNVKESVGGLRALHFARWIAQVFTDERENPFQRLIEQGLLTESELEHAQEGYNFLQVVRNGIAKMRGPQTSTQMTFDIQETLAESLGYEADTSLEISAVEQLLRDYYGSSLAVFRFSYKVIRRIAASERLWPPQIRQTAERPVPFVSLAERSGRIFGLATGFRDVSVPEPVLVPDAPRAPPFELLPPALLPIFQYAADHSLRLSGDLLDIMERSVPRFAEVYEEPSFQTQVSSAFLNLLQTPNDLSYVLLRMHLLGYLAVIFPEFDSLISLTKWDIHHRYTLDFHALKTLELLDKLMFGKALSVREDKVRQSIEKPLRWIRKRGLLRALRLALLLHTLYQIQPDAAGRILKRLSVTPRDVELELVQWLLRHQDRLIQLMRHGGFFDGEGLSHFVEKELKRDYDRWTLLLTFTLLIQLYHLRPERFYIYERELVHAFELTEPLIARPDEIRSWLEYRERERIEDLESQFFALIKSPKKTHVKVELIEDQPPDTAEIVILRKELEDRPGLLAPIAGVFTANDFEILAAEIGNVGTPGNLLDRFVVKDIKFTERLQTAGSVDNVWLETTPRLEGDLIDALEENVSIAKIFEKRRKPFIFSKPKTAFKVPTRVSFKSAEKFTWIDLETLDYPGVLFISASVLAGLGLNILPRKTFIDTEGSDPQWGMKAVSVFAVEYKGRKPSVAQTTRAKNVLRRVLSQETINGKTLEKIVSGRRSEAREKDTESDQIPQWTPSENVFRVLVIIGLAGFFGFLGIWTELLAVVLALPLIYPSLWKWPLEFFKKRAKKPQPVVDRPNFYDELLKISKRDSSQRSEARSEKAVQIAAQLIRKSLAKGKKRKDEDFAPHVYDALKDISEHDKPYEQWSVSQSDEIKLLREVLGPDARDRKLVKEVYEEMTLIIKEFQIFERRLNSLLKKKVKTAKQKAQFSQLFEQLPVLEEMAVEYGLLDILRPQLNSWLKKLSQAERSEARGGEEVEAFRSEGFDPDRHYILDRSPKMQKAVEGMVQEVLNEVVPEEGSAVRWLDMGTGRAIVPLAVLKYREARDIEIVATDFSEPMLQSAQNAVRTQFPNDTDLVTFKQSDLKGRNWIEPDEKFHVITLVNVLAFYPDRSLREFLFQYLRDHLAPGGQVIILGRTPDEFPTERLKVYNRRMQVGRDLNLDFEDKQDLNHRALVDEGYLKTLEKAGFQNVQVSYVEQLSVADFFPRLSEEDPDYDDFFGWLYWIRVEAPAISRSEARPDAGRAEGLLGTLSRDARAEARDSEGVDFDPEPLEFEIRSLAQEVQDMVHDLSLDEFKSVAERLRWLSRELKNEGELTLAGLAADWGSSPDLLSEETMVMRQRTIPDTGIALSLIRINLDEASEILTNYEQYEFDELPDRFMHLLRLSGILMMSLRFSTDESISDQTRETIGQVRKHVNRMREIYERADRVELQRSQSQSRSEVRKAEGGLGKVVFNEPVKIQEAAKTLVPFGPKLDELFKTVGNGIQEFVNSQRADLSNKRGELRDALLNVPDPNREKVISVLKESLPLASIHPELHDLIVRGADDITAVLNQPRTEPISEKAEDVISQETVDLMEAMYRAIVAFEEPIIVEHRLSRAELNDIKPEFIRSEVRSAINLVSRNPYVIVRFDFPREAVRWTHLKDLTNKIIRIQSGNTVLLISREAPEDYLKRLDEKSAITIATNSIAGQDDKVLFSDEFPGGIPIPIEEKTFSRLLLAAVSTQTALSLKTHEILSQLENGDWRLKGPKAFQVLDLLNEALATEKYEKKTFARAA